MKNQTKGIRNNNPLNIRYSERNNWQGLVGRDVQGFCIFESMTYGYRAVWVTLKNYHETFRRQSKKFSLRNIIHRWAPERENNTMAYIRFVSNETGVAPDKDLLLYGNHTELVRIVVAMSKFECGSDFSPDLKQVEDAWALS